MPGQAKELEQLALPRVPLRRSRSKTYLYFVVEPFCFNFLTF
jgi:hypothetical protein